MLVFGLIFCLGISVSFANNECAQKSFSPSSNDDPAIVCVCNATYCDEVPSIRPLKDYEVVIITSDISGKRFHQEFVQFSNQTTENTTLKIKINAKKQFQKIIGFGGAFTDAAGININRLSEKAQKRFLESYFGKTGIGYTIGRVPMASCDFSTHEYSYAEKDGDFNLTEFKLAEEDFKYKIPYIKIAQNLSKNKFKIFGSPWSAPAWMKTNGHMKGGGNLKGEIGGEYYKTWSKYFIRLLEEYNKNGIKLWGVTLQNEPFTGLDPFWSWQTMYFSPEMQRYALKKEENDFRIFVKNLLGPQLRAHPDLKDTKIMVHDDARVLLPTAIDKILNDTDVAKLVDGIAFHWYADQYSPATPLEETHKRHPNHFILMTEACAGFQPWDRGPRLGNWSRAEWYAQDIIQNLQNYAGGWVDWNMALDEEGGPNWVKNFVDAPILVNNTKDEFYKQPMFYVMGHFSKFIEPDSIRIQSSIIGNYSSTLLDFVVFKTKTSQRVLVINNRDSQDYNVTVQDDNFNRYQARIYIEPRSIKTVIWNKVRH